MYVIDPRQCRHPAQIMGKDGKLVCLTCGGEVKPTKAKKPKEPPKDPDQGQEDNTEE